MIDIRPGRFGRWNIVDHGDIIGEYDTYFQTLEALADMKDASSPEPSYIPKREV